MSAANAILDRGYGRPAQSVVLTSRNVYAEMSDEDLIAVIQESRKEAISANERAASAVRFWSWSGNRVLGGGLVVASQSVASASIPRDARGGAMQQE